MWITDIQSALTQLFEIYGLMCCVDKISNNLIFMTNGDVWRIHDDEIERAERID